MAVNTEENPTRNTIESIDLRDSANKELKGNIAQFFHKQGELGVPVEVLVSPIRQDIVTLSLLTKSSILDINEANGWPYTLDGEEKGEKNISPFTLLGGVTIGGNDAVVVWTKGVSGMEDFQSDYCQKLLREVVKTNSKNMKIGHLIPKQWEKE